MGAPGSWAILHFKTFLLHFNDSIASINSAKILQVSMDGPTVNHKFYSKLVEQRKEISAPGMIDIGSCCLHIIYGAFKTGLEATGWVLKTVLKGAYTVLHDTPARHADYFTVTGSNQYPLFFCATRWVEDIKPAERLLSVWPNMQKLFQF